MKFYLASSFDLVGFVQEIANNLTELGHTITVEWWHKDFKKLQLSKKAWYEDKRVENVSKRNFRGIENAEVFLLVTHPNDSRKFNGANIELGYALALGKDCYSIGKLERSAMYVPVKKCSSLSEFLEKLRERRVKRQPK